MRSKWKTVRDGYTKYKKQVKSSTGSGRKNVSYTWASQLAFLDNFNVLRASSSNVSLDATQPSPYTQTPTLDSENSQDMTSQSNPSLLPSTSSSSQIPPSSQALLPESPANTPTASTPRVSCHCNKRSSETRRNDDDVGRVLQFLNAKKKKENDVIDNLFLSYADTFKKFPPREQAIVKLELAKLFSNIELHLLNNNSNDSHFQYSSTTSPTYSTAISDDNHTLYSPRPQPMNLSGDNNNNVSVNNSEQLQVFEEQCNSLQGNLLQLDDYDITQL